jgi:hypothetical protein
MYWTILAVACNCVVALLSQATPRIICATCALFVSSEVEARVVHCVHWADHTS